jgi:DNA-binding MarR family transcriptional regulator
MNNQQVENLVKVKQLIDMLCSEMERDQPLHNVQAYLTVAVATTQGGAPEVREIEQRTGLSSSALSRALGNIGEWSYRNKPGLDLIKARMDYSDRRRKPMVLTEKGEDLAEKIVRILD